MSIFQTIHLSVYEPEHINQSINQSIKQSIDLSIYVSTYLSIYLSIHPSIHASRPTPCAWTRTYLPSIQHVVPFKLALTTKNRSCVMTTGCLPKLFWTLMEQCDSNDACVAVKFVEAEFIKLPGAERIRMRVPPDRSVDLRNTRKYTKQTNYDE